MTNEDRAREIVVPWCPHDECWADKQCGTCVSAVKRVAAALDAAEERGALWVAEGAVESNASGDTIISAKEFADAVCAERRQA